MAASRRSVEAALGAALGAPQAGGAPLAVGPASPLALAYSGGLDSTVLLNVAARLLGGRRLLALHVHHGLQPAAEAWVGHCARACERLGVAFRALRAAGRPAPGESLEAWARERRYALLLEAAREAGAAALLTAHHADDQLETFLLQLARGSGPDGLAGIAPRDCRAGVVLLRPLLGLSRAELLAHARSLGLDWVEDPTNADPLRPRNAVRHRLAPVLHEVLPGLRERLPATLALLADARETLAGQGLADLAAARLETDRPVAARAGAPAGPLRLDRRSLAALPPARRRYALRAWLGAIGAPPAPMARLEAMRDQLLDGTAARGEVAHAGWRLVRQGDRLYAWPAPALPPPPEAAELRWHGEPELTLPGGERIRFLAADDGVSAVWLRGRPLRTGTPAGSARLRPAAGRPTRSLRNLWQEAGVPVCLRGAFPALHVEGRLLWAAPFGMDQGAEWPRDGERVAIAWRPAGPADPRAWWATGPVGTPTI